MAMPTDKNKYRESAKAALDNAIAEVAKEEYKRISEKLSLIVMPRITNYALKPLDRLQDREIPNYN